MAWTTNGFPDSTWTSGRAPLGFGDASVVTNIDSFTTTTLPVAAQYRSTFQVADTTKGHVNFRCTPNMTFDLEAPLQAGQAAP